MGNTTTTIRTPRAVKIWLCIGLFMVFMQVIIGGITRLTGSGLSITEWRVIKGTLPPMSTAEWDEKFELYKTTPQYEKINEGMTMREFKFIFFWEYFHRLWARSMGFIFIIPFFIFYRKGWLSPKLRRKLLIVVMLAALAASFGWIMVKSGLMDRPWVDAYKLMLHLSIGISVYAYLFWTILGEFYPTKKVIHIPMLKTLGITITVILAVQIMLGGLMSGMKAGLLYPTFPSMNGEVIPNIVLNSSEWNVENLKKYDENAFTPSLVQVLHRGTAYLLTIIGLWLFFQIRKVKEFTTLQVGNYLWITMLGIQVLLGIFTLINCKGSIPVTLGVLHQGGALLLLSAALFMNFHMRNFASK